MQVDFSNSLLLTLPMVLVNDIVPLPNCDCRADFTNEVGAFDDAALNQNYIIIGIKNNPNIGDFETFSKSHDYYKRAVLAKVVLKTTTSSKYARVKFDVITRVDIVDVDFVNGHLVATVNTVPKIEVEDESVLALKSLIKKEIVVTKNTSSEDELIFQKVSVILGRNISNYDLADSLGNVCIEKNLKERFKFLLEDNIEKRLTIVLESLRMGKLISEVEAAIDSKVHKNMAEQQKEYLLRERMRAIQEELGDKAKKDSDIEELRKRIKEAKLPEKMEKKCLIEVSRYQSTPTTSPESNIIKTYLDFVLSLPWNNMSEDLDDIKAAKNILDEDHYGLDKVKERILEYLAVKIATKKNPQSILCLVGPPGVGKSSLARSVARALNKKFVKQSLGGMKDESEIRGHRRTYIGALPGRILQSLSNCGTKNPVFLLDEIDKMSSDYKGDPTSAMLEVLDPEQNFEFSDNYLEEPFDLSKCFFIATANYLGNIPAPLRDRLEIIELSSYTEQEKLMIAKKHLIKKQLTINGLEESKFKITDDAILTIIQKYTREAGVREIDRILGTLIRKSIKKILIDNVKKVKIDVDNLEEYLGKNRFENSDNLGKDLVGVVTGLAYTEFGGDTLQIEVSHFNGTGRLIITGKLGDVMKESCEIALSYVKANASKFGIELKDLEKQDIHIHVPEGAVPKDGPSAGVTITTAIVSAFSNKKADHLIGMTGEMTLRGQILPIGGLREKSIAAKRSGLSTILIPKDNEKDLDDIPQIVKDSLKIIPIEEATDAINYTLK